MEHAALWKVYLWKFEFIFHVRESQELKIIRCIIFKNGFALRINFHKKTVMIARVCPTAFLWFALENLDPSASNGGSKLQSRHFGSTRWLLKLLDGRKRFRLLDAAGVSGFASNKCREITHFESNQLTSGSRNDEILWKFFGFQPQLKNPFRAVFKSKVSLLALY